MTLYLYVNQVFFWNSVVIPRKYSCVFSCRICRPSNTLSFQKRGFEIFEQDTWNCLLYLTKHSRTASLDPVWYDLIYFGTIIMQNILITRFEPRSWMRIWQELILLTHSSVPHKTGILSIPTLLVEMEADQFKVIDTTQMIHSCMWQYSKSIALFMFS